MWGSCLPHSGGWSSVGQLPGQWAVRCGSPFSHLVWTLMKNHGAMLSGDYQNGNATSKEVEGWCNLSFLCIYLVSFKLQTMWILRLKQISNCRPKLILMQTIFFKCSAAFFRLSTKSLIDMFIVRTNTDMKIIAIADWDFPSIQGRCFYRLSHLCCFSSHFLSHIFNLMMHSYPRYPPLPLQQDTAPLPVNIKSTQCIWKNACGQCAKCVMKESWLWMPAWCKSRNLGGVVPNIDFLHSVSHSNFQHYRKQCLQHSLLWKNLTSVNTFTLREWCCIRGTHARTHTSWGFCFTIPPESCLWSMESVDEWILCLLVLHVVGLSHTN